MTVELKYPIGDTGLFARFVNWLEGEFDLYQTEFVDDTLYIDHPLNKCTVSKEFCQNSLHANLKITGQSLSNCQYFLKNIEELYKLLNNIYLNVK